MTKVTTKNSFTAKWLWLLFLIVIPSSIFSLISNENLTSIIPSLEIVGTIGSTLCTFAYSLILLKLSSEYNFYKIAGICSIVSTVLKPFDSETLGLSMIISFINIILVTISIFYEFSAHSDILDGIDNKLSTKWAKLAVWTVVFYVSLLLGTIFVGFAPFLTLLTLLISLIGILVVEILKLIYLYKTANIFKKLAKEENVSRETLIE